MGDAGSATIIESGNDEWAFDIHTDGSGFDKLIISENGHLYMDGSAIMEFALAEVHKSFQSVLDLMSWSKSDINQAFLHQLNEFMLNYLRKKLQLSKEQVPISVRKYRNTGSASIPLTICNQLDNRGKSILSGFGVGLSWSSVGLNLDKTKVFQPIAPSQ